MDLNELTPEEIVELGYLLNDEMEKEASEYYEDEMDLNDLSPEEIVELGYLLNDEMEKEASEYYEDDYYDLNEFDVEDFIEFAADLEEEMEKEAGYADKRFMAMDAFRAAKAGVRGGRRAGRFAGRKAKQGYRAAKRGAGRAASSVGPAMERAGSTAQSGFRSASSGLKSGVRKSRRAAKDYMAPTMGTKIRQSYKSRASRARGRANQMAGRSRRGGLGGRFGFTSQNRPSFGQKAMAYGREFSPEISAGGAAVTLGALMQNRRGE